MKVLHISFHKGCQNDIEYISEQLGFELTFMEYNDGISKGCDKYNVTQERALASWNKHKEFYNQFDCIITSDTAPISRVFLQNNWSKRLIIWICNRFDYANQPAVGFPDQEYYDLINDVKNRPNVSIVGYTPFETYYANVIRGLSIGNECIKPIGKIGEVYKNYNPTQIPDKDKTFIIGPYHNDNIMMNLREKVESLGIKVFNGRYNGPRDLAEFAGVIHIPYAWSNLAFFEAIQLEIIYFIPSKSFFFELSNKPNFWFQNHNCIDKIHLSEWYCEDFREALVYFDSWEDLSKKVVELDVTLHKKVLRKIGDKHEMDTLGKWEKYILLNLYNGYIRNIE
jgi:hypothetical protein